MKSVNGDSALWNSKQRGSINGIAGPNCCWYAGCCWFWAEMTSHKASGSDAAKA